MIFKHLLSTFLFVTLFFVSSGIAQSPVGVWEVKADDQNEKSVAHVQLYMQEGKLQGKVVKLLQGSSNAVCSKCPTTRKNKKVDGMQVLTDLVPQGSNKWGGGKAMDTSKGKSYDVQISFRNGNSSTLYVRGTLKSETRTQTWTRVR